MDGGEEMAERRGQSGREIEGKGKEQDVSVNTGRPKRAAARASAQALRYASQKDGVVRALLEEQEGAQARRSSRSKRRSSMKRKASPSSKGAAAATSAASSSPLSSATAGSRKRKRSSSRRAPLTVARKPTSPKVITDVIRAGSVSRSHDVDEDRDAEMEGINSSTPALTFADISRSCWLVCAAAMEPGTPLDVRDDLGIWYEGHVVQLRTRGGVGGSEDGGDDDGDDCVGDDAGGQDGGERDKDAAVVSASMSAINLLVRAVETGNGDVRMAAATAASIEATEIARDALAGLDAQRVARKKKETNGAYAEHGRSGVLVAIKVHCECLW